MTKEQVEILQHSLGVDHYGRGQRYRNFFCAGEDGNPICESLVQMGYMARSQKTPLCDSIHYHVTEAGVKAMIHESPAEPKLTPGQKRYREWLNVADVIGLSFGEWLKLKH